MHEFEVPFGPYEIRPLAKFKADQITFAMKFCIMIMYAEIKLLALAVLYLAVAECYLLNDFLEEHSFLYFQI